jgi:transcriptional regulator with XRE-family HTH domain
MSGTKNFRVLREKLEERLNADEAARARFETTNRAMRDAFGLAEAREQCEMTQQAVARRMGVTQANISRIERESDVYLSTLRKYIEALGGRLEVAAVFPEKTVMLTEPGEAAGIEGPVRPDDDVAAVSRVVAFRGESKDLAGRIGSIAAVLVGQTAADAVSIYEAYGVDSGLLTAALRVKHMSAQINTILHAIGILIALPHLLEDDERIERVSLGTAAGIDLETNRRIAAFKFIQWKGNDSNRLSSLLADVFHLAVADTTKRRVLYLTGIQTPLKLLASGRRVQSVLKDKDSVLKEFNAVYPGKYEYTGEYWAAVSGQIEVVDLLERVPELACLDSPSDAKDTSSE